MKQIENKISSFIENQFPSFYKEDGPVFIEFVKAYYEWLEQSGNAVGEARKLSQYKDIDTTIDDFILHFKEKYLKNIQFDTTTNKILLVKNALDLYKSKGTERSIDLFFRLIYGTDAEVRYPADNIFRLSDGVWVRPTFLEITDSKYNVDYLGKQIIGSKSGAKAFVEKYIRRKTANGYVNLLYVSGIQGEFNNGEVIGINLNNSPKFNISKRSKLVGSIKQLLTIDKSRNFKVGDTVKIVGATGIGGLARVAEVDAATGLVDFIFVDGGFGYTLTSNAIISEKVISFENVVIDNDNDKYFHVLQDVYQPLVNISFTSATTTFKVGDVLSRYVSNNLAAYGDIIDIDQENDNGTITLSRKYGSFTNGSIYYTASNTNSLYANTVEDRTLSGKIMGSSNNHEITLIGASNISLGANVYQKDSQSIFGYGTVTKINGDVITVENPIGSFKNSVSLENERYTQAAGTIVANTLSVTITGSGTSFSNDYINAVIYNSSNVALGVVASISNSTSLTLSTSSTANVSGDTFSYGLKYPLFVENSSNTANVVSVGFSAGFYDIGKNTKTLNFSSSNNDNIVNSDRIYQYYTNGSVKFVGSLITGEVSSNTGNLSYISINGYPEDSELIYTDSNTAKATVVYSTANVAGGDFKNLGTMITTANTKMTPYSISNGSGADFSVSTIGDEEQIFINTDLMNSNNQNSIDYSRKSLSVASNTGFVNGLHVYQEVNKIAFNPSTSLNNSTGFITIPSANTRYIAGDIVKYTVASGNTAINNMIADDFYYVYSSNSTGLMLSYPYDKNLVLNTTNYQEFANNTISESGHFIHKIASGKIFEIGSGLLRIKNIIRDFGVTGGTANTTQSSNGNVILYTNTSVNTSISSVSSYTTIVNSNTNYMNLPLSYSSYGFPKNTQGDVRDIIYSILSFDAFNIGSIGTINNINPGSDYNVDPFVLVYQPYIVGFDRKDFLITYENGSGGFLEGEKVNQTNANLTFYDLKLSSGVFGNTYNEITHTIDSKSYVNSGSDFIYIANTNYTFNANTNVSNTDDFLSFTNTDLESNNYVLYYTDTGNTALSGLTNSSFYYIINANTTGVKLSSTEGGSAINITASSINESGHHILKMSNPHSNNTKLIYSVPTGNTAISGLANNTQYYVVNSNSSGLSLSSTLGGSAINITAAGTNEIHYLNTIPGYLPGESVYQFTNTTFNANSSVNSSLDFISLTNQIFTDGDLVTYSTATGNTVVSGLANNTQYYIVNSNSTGIKLSSSIGGSAINITKGLTETGHILSANVTGVIQSLYISSSEGYARIKNANNTFANGFILYSNTNPYVNGSVSNVSISSIISTAKGLIKSSNSSVMKIKRLTFENTFEPGATITGDVTGSTATIVSVLEDDNEEYPIGLNAVIEANVATANGRVIQLQVIDSGFGYSNSEIVQFTSEDETRSGTAKVILNGHGLGKGYYKSSKGFLSSDMYLHDGDYYQEYSYEIISKISIDKYSDMFKKVMHMAGTKFFGSVLLFNENQSSFDIKSISRDIEISFNSKNDVDTSNDRINIDVEKNKRSFNAISSVNNSTDFITIINNPFIDGDIINYVVESGNTAVTGLANNTQYYVVNSNSTGIKLSSSLNGSAINITGSVSEYGHNLISFENPFINGDLVTYTTSTGNTAVTGLANNSSYYVANSTSRSIKLSDGNNLINITSAAVGEVGHYLTKTIEE